MKNKFNVGDKVRITKSGYGTYPDDIGKTTTVLGVSPGFVVYDTRELKLGEFSWAREKYTGNVEAFEFAVEPVVVRTPDEVRKDRRKELLDGIVAYHTTGKEVPDAWITELAYGRMGL